MLFLPPAHPTKPRAGSFIRDEDIHKVIQFIEEQRAPTTAFHLYQHGAPLRRGRKRQQKRGRRPPLRTGYDIIVQTGNASTTFLQRKLKVGLCKGCKPHGSAGADGVVSAADGAKARTVLLRNSYGRLFVPLHQVLRQQPLPRHKKHQGVDRRRHQRTQSKK